MLAGVVATNCWHYGITGLPADNESIVLANSRTWSIQIKFEKIQSDLANIWLTSSNGDRTGSRVGEWSRRSRVSKIGSIISDSFAARDLN